MRQTGTWIGWTAAALLGVAVAAWAFPRALIFYPDEWSLTRKQAVEIAMERFRELGEPLEDPYVVVELDENAGTEMRLLESADRSGLETLRSSRLAEQVLQWRVTLYEPGKRPNQWTYQATLALDGTVTALRLGVPADEAAEEIDPDVARRRADELLARSGFDVDRFGAPELRRTDRAERTDLSFKYRDEEALLGAEVPYGVQVDFAGERLAGFRPWLEDPDSAALQQRLQTVNLFGTSWILMPFLVFPFAALSFIRRYHEGEVGVKRGVQVFAVMFVSGVILLALVARSATEGFNFGLSRAQTTWAWGLQLAILWFSMLAAIGALSWSVGEARCREHWGAKLAAFDALFQRRWSNATVARSSLRGLGAGMALGAALLLALLASRSFGIETGMSLYLGPWWHNANWAGLTLVLFILPIKIYVVLFTWLFLLPGAVRRLGMLGGGAAVAVVAGIIFWPPFFALPAWSSLLFGILQAAILVAVFLRYDLLTALLASLASDLLLNGLPYLLADAPFLQLQGALPLAAIAIPFVLSARYLGSDTEFHYRYEDVPPHVKRIAERERQRVELETARRIQSSILPDLPPRLGGVELAHAYLPASEVGGDFYDVLDLEDGRLALAVGDVAGHGVSSGLVMSMAKSTLALQVTVDPDVEVVLQTLNRMVYKTARQRLLTTLCYALLDTGKLELTYGSAGHLAPYRISTDGRAEALEAASYPLGVRNPSAYIVRTVQLAPEDRLFMFSDGVVEACSEGTDEVFGFDRLQASLERHAAEGPAGLRDGVLDDLRRYMGPCPREDDQTILVLKLP
ncbi:MAG: PP2C family protein-serine/threonine phosphatase [bacterium]|nr:PP2C family protein-serine/threonine phosphatase [bacterium]